MRNWRNTLSTRMSVNKCKGKYIYRILLNLAFCRFLRYGRADGWKLVEDYEELVRTCRDILIHRDVTLDALLSLWSPNIIFHFINWFKNISFPTNSPNLSRVGLFVCTLSLRPSGRVNGDF